MELVETLRVSAERAREGQLVQEHQSDQVSRASIWQCDYSYLYMVVRKCRVLD
jgi:hypothetical protein